MLASPPNPATGRDGAGSATSPPAAVSVTPPDAEPDDTEHSGPEAAPEGTEPFPGTTPGRGESGAPEGTKSDGPESFPDATPGGVEPAESEGPRTMGGGVPAGCTPFAEAAPDAAGGAEHGVPEAFCGLVE
ncbi:hypothetical protein ACFYTQ_30035 [Nocardia sp. NPDC004068]|uniref:hypothetical protein n=1 Tax=Nocardia sp. NPDC004068 TaxID=3364303 RepID=UPI0036CF5439